MVLVNDADKTHLLGGEIRALAQPKNAKFGKYVLTPREVRKLLASKGWNRVVAFQTRNPLHRAHEYALVYGLEKLLKEGHNAGSCLNPLIGETKGHDVNAEIRMHTYKPVKVGFAAFYESLGRVDLTENHKEEKPISISGKQVRETLMKGELVDPRIMRPSTSRILGEAMKAK